MGLMGVISLIGLMGLIGLIGLMGLICLIGLIGLKSRRMLQRVGHPPLIIMPRQCGWQLCCFVHLLLMHSAYYASTTSFSSASLILRPSTRYAVGAAMKSEEQVPKITPSIIAKENERMLSPPKMKIQSNTMSVDTDVLIVRARVEFNDMLKSNCLSRLG